MNKKRFVKGIEALVFLLELVFIPPMILTTGLTIIYVYWKAGGRSIEAFWFIFIGTVIWSFTKVKDIYKTSCTDKGKNGA